MHAHSGKTAARRAGAVGAGRFRTGGGLSVAPPAGYRHSADERPCLHSDAFLPGAHSLRRHAPQPEAARGALRQAVLSHRKRHDQPEGVAPLPVFRGRADRGAAPPERYRPIDGRVRHSGDGRHAQRYPHARGAPRYRRAAPLRRAGDGLPLYPHQRRDGAARKSSQMRQNGGMAARRVPPAGCEKPRTGVSAHL